MKKNYLIYTLDAKAIIQGGIGGEPKASKNRFTLNLSTKGFSDLSKVLSCDKHADNALFYQITSVISVSKDISEDSILKDKILFLDFNKIFKSSTRHITTAEVFYDPSNHDVLLALQDLFNPNGGLEVSFDGTNYTHFVAFDKSNSMTKKSRISFLSSDIKEKLNKRLTLGIDFSSIRVDISKYYSYRGLYLSSGYRIDPKKVHLDSDNVIVISDAEEKSSEENVFTVKDAGADLLEFIQKKMNLCINAFDGEGLITPEYASRINQCLCSDHGIEGPANSFQIRLPFAKGMLHRVDFHRMIKQEFQLDPNNIIIKDMFGVDRCLGEAQLILTKSMFKCAGWLIETCKDVDPMSFYFKAFQQDDHALYISGLDSRLTHFGKVRLNHQFLSTLDLNKQDFLGIVREYEDSIDGVSRLKKGYNLGEENNTEVLDENDDESEASGQSYKQFIETISKAVSMNEGFLRDYKVKETIKTLESGLENDLALAKPEVSGEQRYLSGDLFAFVIHVLKQSISDICLEPYYKKTIKAGCFYMPANTSKLEPGHNYTFLRNPHLSRNEQCILRYSSARESLYNEYFSHLKGIVMVPYKSTVPMILSGADFDGDIVKILFDKRITNCVMRSCYSLEGKELKRKEPVVVIPSPKARTCVDTGCIPADTVIDTFSNNIGLISNMAVKYADIEYCQTIESDYKNRCAECTIVTGLEIDAAKNGKHPSRNIKMMKQELLLISNTFLDFKREYLKLKNPAPTSSPRAIIEGDKGKLLFNANGSCIEDIAMLNAGFPGSVLSMVPGEYVNYLYNKENRAAPFEPVSKHLFIFEQDPNWRTNLQSHLINEVESIINSYSSIKVLERKIRKYREKHTVSTFIGYINTLIDIKYDDHSQVLSEGIDIEHSVDIALIEVGNCFQQSVEVIEAIGRLTTKKWHFTTEEGYNTQLNTILGVPDCTTVLSDTTRSLLYDFRFKGYMLLYYILQEVLTILQEDISIEEWRDHNVDKLDNNYYSDLKTDLIKNDSKKKSASICEESRVEKCRTYLSALFDGDFDLALQYVYACPNNSKRSTFMWNVFKRSELINNIYTGDNDHAE